jgi:hypothetical protein
MASMLGVAGAVLACSGSREADPMPAPESSSSRRPVDCTEQATAGDYKLADLPRLPDGGTFTVQLTRRGCPLTIEYQIKSAPGSE